MELKKQVLSEDLDGANKIMLWGNYCTAQMQYCLSRFNLEGARYWNLEYQRSVNDLKHLQFKKIEQERKGIDVKI